MPKIYLTESQKDYERIKNNLTLMQGKLSCYEMSKIIGTSKSTYINRLKHPEQLTIKEIYKICKYFKIPISSFLADKLTLK